MAAATQNIWITGASSGIGEALALQWAGQGVFLVLSGRDHARLQAVASECEKRGSVTMVLVFDLTDEQAREEAVCKVENTLARLDILVNNGGVSQRSSVLETTQQTARAILELDFWSHAELTRRLLPFILRTGGCHLVVMSSLSGLFGFPQRAYYCASKHALHGFFETLYIENARAGVELTMVCPGRVNTPISLHALTADGKPHGQMDDGQLNGVPVEECARQVLKAVRKQKKLVLIGGKELWMVRIKKFAPWLFYKIAMKLDPNK